MEELTEILQAATAAIPEGYFRLRIDGGDPIYRERVYCYELYHQMRLLWPADTPFYLNGEIDKAAHPILTDLGAAFAKPDLLVHQPGYMTGNHAVIEVKPDTAKTDGIRADLDKLSLFVGTVGYQRAIYLVYGDDAEAAAVRIADQAEGRAATSLIELWLHTAVGRPAWLAATFG